MSTPRFLQGGDELGALIRGFDWSSTVLGPADEWPQSLKTAVSIMLDSHFGMYIAWGPEFIQLYNDPYRPILGSTKHPAIGRRASDTFAESWQIIGPLFERVMGGQAVGSSDWMLPLDRHGYLEECFFTFSYSPIRDESGDVGGVLVTVTETTERVLSDRRLRTLRELAAAATIAGTEARAWSGATDAMEQNAADVPFAAIYAIESDGRSARLVERTERVSHTGLLPPTIELDAAEPAWPLTAALASREPVLVENLRERFGDVIGPVWPEPVQLAALSPITRPNLAHPYGVLVTGISPRRSFDDAYRDFLLLAADHIATAIANARALAEERERAEALAEIDRAKTAFFSNVSHEFRTPLTLMLGPTEDALASPDRALRGEELERVHRSELRLLKLVNALLDFSRIQAGRMQASFEPADLATITRDLASTFESTVERGGLHYEVVCEPLPEPVYVDRDMWEKIVLNLLSNAFKFTFDGTIRLELEAVADRVELRVSDTGVGIAPNELPHLFTRFHRVEGARSRTYEGSGIGLALVQDLVELHGGEISVASEIGRGTTFTVSLPTGTHHLPADRIRAAPSSTDPPRRADSFVAEAERWLPDAGAGPTMLPGDADDEALTSAARSAHVLVADDNADMRGYLHRLLSEHFTVDVVADGVQALAAARARRPDMILADVMMPGLDGFGLLHEVRGDPETAGIPFLMLSARAGEEARIEGLRAGADDYMVKPFSAKELLAHVQTHLQLSRLRAEAAAAGIRLRELFLQSPIAISVLSGPEHRYELTNPPYLEMVQKKDLVGKTVAEVWPELVGTPLMGVFDQVFRTGEPFVADEYTTALDRRGTGVPEECFFKFNLAATRDGSGAVTGMMCTAVEITEQVRARREAEAARAEAEQATRTKDEFLAMLGHELRNPLAPILTALELMRLRGIGAADRERTIIERQVRHVVSLVDDLLDVSRITRGKIELTKAPIELAHVVARSIEMVSPLLEQRQHTVDVQVPRQDLAVHGDAERLAQVVSNLLTNAAKYTEPKGRIRVTGAREEGFAVLSIEDSGIGIDPLILPRVFDLFAQGRQALDRSHGGLGLGLSIVRSLVALHDGTVEASSEGPGHGATFTVRLPLADAAPGDAPGRRDDGAVREPPSEGCRILIVDDNEDAAVMMATLLRALGYETQVALDGPAALEAAREFSPEVALLDIGLPVMDGYELSRRLRDTPGLQDVKLIAVTGYGQSRDREQSRVSGFNAHLVKPIDIERLSGVLAELVGSVGRP